LTTFIQSLINTTFDEEANDIFELEEGIKFFGLEDEPSKLYIRKCYNHLLGVVNNSSIRKLRISGNPGIGKTLFGYYLLYHLVKKNETIVYDSNNLIGEVIVFDKGNGFYLNCTDHNTKRGYLYNRDNWYIVDGKQPDRAVAKTVLICSLRKDHYREFDKQNPDIRIMPVWTWEEINDCRKEIFKHLSEEVVRTLYMKWGGIPQYVLMSAENSEIQNKIQQAIDSCNEKIFQFISASDSSEDVSYMLIHIWTNVSEEDNLKEDNDNKGKGKETDEVKSIGEGQYYTQTIIKFASDYVGERITERLKDMIMSRLQAEVEACLSNGKSINNAYFGCYFEQVVHRMFRKGGTFFARSLESDQLEYEITLKSQNEILKFSKVEMIENNKYYQPDSQTFPAIDSIIAPNYLFQMTIATNHPIKLSGLKAVEEKLAEKGPIYYFFVVPSKLSDGYIKQDIVVSQTSQTSKTSKTRKITETGELVAQNKPTWIDDYLKQYVIGIDLSSVWK
jgi:hypothetical protein